MKAVLMKLCQKITWIRDFLRHDVVIYYDKNYSTDFYRATLCISAVFAVVRYPSFRPYVFHDRVLYPDG